MNMGYSKQITFGRHLSKLHENIDNYVKLLPIFGVRCTSISRHICQCIYAQKLLTVVQICERPLDARGLSRFEDCLECGHS